jgi:hypothetical protein
VVEKRKSSVIEVELKQNNRIVCGLKSPDRSDLSSRKYYLN